MQADTVNEERPSEQLSDDLEIEEVTRLWKDDAKATDFDSTCNENGLHSRQAVDGELSVSGSLDDAHGEVSAGVLTQLLW